MFMNNDLFVTQRSWLRVLVDEALSGDRIGAVGGKFIYPDMTVQHGGVILGVGGVGEHAHRGLDLRCPRLHGPRPDGAGTIGSNRRRHAVRRATAFADVGGFDETDLLVAFNDVDLCLKLRVQPATR